MRSPIKVDVNHFFNVLGRSDRRRFLLPLGVEMPLVRVEEAAVDILVEGLHEGIRVSGTAEINLEVNCYRCMEEWRGRRMVGFDRMVRRFPDSDGYRLPDDGWLYLDGIVVDEVVLSLPTAPLCEEGCRGICSGCGIHLNAAVCECVMEDTKSPFAVLSQYL